MSSSVLLICVALCAILLLSGCKEEVIVTIVDSGDQTPTFKIESAALIGSDGTDIVGFWITESYPDGRVKEILWQIQAVGGESKRISHITFGIVPAGFREVRPPKQLVSGAKYEAEAGAPGKSGHISFVLH